MQLDDLRVQAAKLFVLGVQMMGVPLQVPHL